MLDNRHRSDHNSCSLCNACLNTTSILMLSKQTSPIQEYNKELQKKITIKNYNKDYSLVKMHSFDFNIENCRVITAPETAYYISEFITPTEEKGILSNIYAAPKPKWTQLSNRRLQNWGGIPHNKGMIAESIPPWLDKYLEKIHGLNVMDGKRPNHVLVNEYLPGQGIMPHLDGSLFYPTITTISAGSHIVLNFLEPPEDNSTNTKPVFSFLLEPRSLLILQEKLYTRYLHCIEELKEDVLDASIVNLNMCSDKFVRNITVPRQTRVSLTIRHVPKTTSYKFFAGVRR